MPANIVVDRGQTVVAPESLPQGTIVKVYPSVPLSYVRGLETLAVSTANVLSFASVAKVLAGDNLSGTNIPGGTTASSVNSTASTVTLSAPVTSTGVASGASIALSRSVTTTGASAAGTTVLVPSTANLAVNDTVAGTNVPGGTTIASITDGTHIVLSAATTSSGVASGAVLTFGRTLTTNAATLTTSTAPLNLSVTPVPHEGVLGNAYQSAVGAVVYNERTTSFTELSRATAKGWALIPMANVTKGAPTYV